MFTSERQAICFSCPQCGASLQIPQNTRGKVICQYCQCECFVDGLVKNREIMEKDNINSGVSINIGSEKLKNILVDILTEVPYAPLDVLNKAIVVQEEHISVPSYLFYCNAMAPFTYEAGNAREHKTAIDLGDRTRVETETYTEWTQMSSSTSVSTTCFASGNKDLADVIQALFAHYDPNLLADVEELEMPCDVITLPNNLPQVSAFNENIKPYIENLLQESAIKILQGKKTRNLCMGGSNIQKEETIRVMLGVYHIVLQYKDAQYDIFVSGDGNAYCYSDIPTDPVREKEYKDLLAKKKEQQKGGKVFVVLAVICAIAAIFTMGISLVGTILFGFLHFSNKKKYKSAQSDCQEQFDALTNEAKAAKQAFLQGGQLLKGMSRIS